ncbi:uncharacterized protein LOC135931488 [Gordionus sp. m RMFG-2023]|uniref:uncharacterized protein LOC135931488 n=1 Tax=Gordionus sp. m RMFG-2023 TaxID=3053472 RepID=UPI0031FCB17A
MLKIPLTNDMNLYNDKELYSHKHIHGYIEQGDDNVINDRKLTSLVLETPKINLQNVYDSNKTLLKTKLSGSSHVTRHNKKSSKDLSLLDNLKKDLLDPSSQIQPFIIEAAHDKFDRIKNRKRSKLPQGDLPITGTLTLDKLPLINRSPKSLTNKVSTDSKVISAEMITPPNPLPRLKSVNTKPKCRNALKRREPARFRNLPVGLNLKTLINLTTWHRLDSLGHDMNPLVSLLPLLDRAAFETKTGSNRRNLEPGLNPPSPLSVLNNEFLSASLSEYHKRRRFLSPSVIRSRSIKRKHPILATSKNLDLDSNKNQVTATNKGHKNDVGLDRASSKHVGRPCKGEGRSVSRELLDNQILCSPKTDLKALINTHAWEKLEKCGQNMTHLTSLLPSTDRALFAAAQKPKDTINKSSVLNNAFLSSSLVQWKSNRARLEDKIKMSPNNKERRCHTTTSFPSQKTNLPNDHKNIVAQISLKEVDTFCRVVIKDSAGDQFAENKTFEGLTTENASPFKGTDSIGEQGRSMFTRRLKKKYDAERQKGCLLATTDPFAGKVDGNLGEEINISDSDQEKCSTFLIGNSVPAQNSSSYDNDIAIKPPSKKVHKSCRPASHQRHNSPHIRHTDHNYNVFKVKKPVKSIKTPVKKIMKDDDKNLDIAEKSEEEKEIEIIAHIERKAIDETLLRQTSLLTFPDNIVSSNNETDTYYCNSNTVWNGLLTPSTIFIPTISTVPKVVMAKPPQNDNDSTLFSDKIANFQFIIPKILLSHHPELAGQSGASMVKLKPIPTVDKVDLPSLTPVKSKTTKKSASDDKNPKKSKSKPKLKGKELSAKPISTNHANTTKSYDLLRAIKPNFITNTLNLLEPISLAPGVTSSHPAHNVPSYETLPIRLVFAPKQNVLTTANSSPSIISINNGSLSHSDNSNTVHGTNDAVSHGPSFCANGPSIITTSVFSENNKSRRYTYNRSNTVSSRR